FQPLDQFSAKLIEFCMDRIPATQSEQPSQGNVISVYSAAGGTGKTMTAWNLARSLAFYGHKVFLLDLQTVQTPSPFSCSQDGEEGGRSARLLYYLKSKPLGLSARISALKSVDPLSKLDFMEPIEQAGEVESLTLEHVLVLIHSLVSMGYDFVVIDLDSSFNERIKATISISNLVLWLVTDDINCLMKTQKAIQQLTRPNMVGSKDAAQTLFVLNRFTGGLNNDLAAFNIEPAVYLPYVPSWKSVASASRLLDETVIQEALAGLIHQHLAPKELSGF
ncbi:MAG: AAA family ATPase, partial [Gorillibacterium sp.]|nr:AAA family ATPase [Gorillibacterium sp.]